MHNTYEYLGLVPKPTSSKKNLLILSFGLDIHRESYFMISIVILVFTSE